MLGADLRPEHKQPFLDAAEELATNWMREHTVTPGTLFHYTTADGLIGILQSKSIWVTDVRYMNDPSELLYARELIRKQLAKSAADSTATSICEEFVQRVSATFDPFEYGFQAYVSCFCEDGDLLSQWRAYSDNGGGYSIGFDFLATLPMFDRRVMLRRVIYDPPIQESIVEKTIDRYFQILVDCEDGATEEYLSRVVLPAACEYFAQSVGEFLFCFKHPYFSSEREWRLVHVVQRPEIAGGSMPRCSFRSYNGNIIPYVPVSFDRAIAQSAVDALNIPFPVRVVRTGPRVDAGLNEQSIRLLISNLSTEVIVPIETSLTSLRW